MRGSQIALDLKGAGERAQQNKAIDAVEAEEKAIKSLEINLHTIITANGLKIDVEGIQSTVAIKNESNGAADVSLLPGNPRGGAKIDRSYYQEYEDPL